MSSMKILAPLSAALLLGICATAMTQTPQMSDPSGIWIVAEGNARIRIRPCGEVYWGVMDWVRNPSAPSAFDRNNPDPAKRSRPIIGVPILIAMKASGSNEWKGEIYNAENGKMYDARISLANPDALKVSGCVLGGIFCGGQTWTRYKEDDATLAAKGSAGAINKTVGTTSRTGAKPSAADKADADFCASVSG